MAQAPDAYAQRLLAERARREAARKAAASAPQRKPQIGMPSNLGQMVSRQPSPDRVGQVRQAITQGVDYAGNFLMQGRAPEIGGAVRSMVEPVAQFPVTAVTDPLRAANQAQQALDPAYAMARGLTTTRLGAEEGNLGDVAAGVTEMGLAGLSFVPGGAAVKGARSMPPAPVRRPPPIGQPNVLAPQASRGPILNQLAPEPAPVAPAKAKRSIMDETDAFSAKRIVRTPSEGAPAAPAKAKRSIMDETDAFSAKSPFAVRRREGSQTSSPPMSERIIPITPEAAPVAPAKAKRSIMDETDAFSAKRIVQKPPSEGRNTLEMPPEVSGAFVGGKAVQEPLVKAAKAYLKAKATSLDDIKSFGEVFGAATLLQAADKLTASEALALVKRLDPASAVQATAEPNWMRNRLSKLLSGNAVPEPVVKAAKAPKEAAPRKKRSVMGETDAFSARRPSRAVKGE